MPDDVGLDTSIPPTGWQKPDEQASDRPAPKRRRRQTPDAPDQPSQPTRPEPAEGVGTTIDVIA